MSLCHSSTYIKSPHLQFAVPAIDENPLEYSTTASIFMIITVHLNNYKKSKDRSFILGLGIEHILKLKIY